MSGRSDVISADGLGKRFNGEPILDGIDLSLGRGEVTLLMGPNGEGKTILLCCLAGGLRPTTGRARIEGRPAHAAGARLSFLLQGSVGLPALTGPENARFYAALHPASTGRWRSLLDRFGMTDPSTVLKHCSGGMRRKVELAVALDPAVPALLLDEPSAELDLGSVHVLHRVLRERRDDGAAVVMTSHSPLDARLADRLVFLRAGAVVADDRPDQLLAAMPPVVRLEGAVHEAVSAVRPLLRGEHAYGTGTELRGVLPPEQDVDDVAAVVADVDVTVTRTEPTARDLYAYFTAIRKE